MAVVAGVGIAAGIAVCIGLRRRNFSQLRPARESLGEAFLQQAARWADGPRGAGGGRQ